jgi:hypothetical protein
MICGSKKLLPQLQHTFDGWQKEDPPTLKKLLVEADVPEFIAEQGLRAAAMELEKAVGDLTLIAFYYLLCVGEYTTKGTCNKTKQTVQFKYANILFFKKNAWGQLQCLSRSAPDSLI